MEMTFVDLFIQKTSSDSESSEDYDYEHLETIEKLLESDSENEENLEEVNSEEVNSQGEASQDVRKSWVLGKYQTKTDKNSYEGQESQGENSRGQELQNETRNSKYKLINRRIDSNRIRHKMANNLEVHTSVCKNVKICHEGPIRSGAIIYTHFQGKTYFCMGIDSCYGDLTDFAGGVKKGESVLKGGLRELHEESLGVFGELNESDIGENLAFYSNNMVIMFIRLSVDIEKTRNDFLARAREKEILAEVGQFPHKLEVSNIYWLAKNDFLDSISGKGRKMYNRVQKILSKVTEIVQAL